MSANCPKCGTYGNRHGGHYVCPICNTTWDTDATVQGNVRSQLHDQMRENANSWNEQKERTYKSFNDTDKAIASAKQVRSNHGYPETKKKKGIVRRLITGGIVALIAGLIFKNEGAIIIGFILGCIFPV